MTAFLHVPMRRRCLRLYHQAKVDLGNDRRSVLVKPLTFMNRSGDIIRYFIPQRFSVDQLIVILDNLDLNAGTFRLRRGGSSAGHHGLKSLMGNLGSGNFIRIYVGIGRPEPGVTVVDHVLGGPEDPEERDALSAGVAAAAEAAIRLCRGEDFEEVARDYNKRNRPR